MSVSSTYVFASFDTGLFYLCIWSLVTHLSQGICMLLSAPVAGICLLLTLITVPKVLFSPLSLPLSLQAPQYSSPFSKSFHSPSPFPSPASSPFPSPSTPVLHESQGANEIMCQRQSEKCMHS